MSRFNKAVQPAKPDTSNYENIPAFKQSAELELVNLLLTSFAQDQYYRTAEAAFTQLRKLLKLTEPGFARKAAVYARHEIGMRSITHVLASELARYVSGENGVSFYAQIVDRPDDITEILSYHLGRGQKVTNAMRKGFSIALRAFSEYSLSKYKGSDKAVSLVDAVNMCHPKPTKALTALMTGQLQPADTWETALSKAGQTGESKGAEWARLLQSGKLGYLALLRNLRNIIEQAPELTTNVCLKLVDEIAIARARIFPFQYHTAMQALMESSTIHAMENRKVVKALSDAMELSLKHVPVFEGRTLVVLDTSGSMSTSISKYNKMRPADIGALFAAMLCKVNMCDLMEFATEATYLKYNPANPVVTMAAGIKFDGGATNFDRIYKTANKAYDRIIILSDMQDTADRTMNAYHTYCRTWGVKPFVYNFDLQGYGNMTQPENKMYCLAGFSDKALEVMRLLETDKQALVNTIKTYEYGPRRNG